MQENSVGKALEIIWKKVFILGKSKGNGPVFRREKMEILLVGREGEALWKKLKIKEKRIRVVRNDKEKLEGDFLIFAYFPEKEDRELVLKLIEKIKGRKILLAVISEKRKEKAALIKAMKNIDHLIAIDSFIMEEVTEKEDSYKNIIKIMKTLRINKDVLKKKVVETDRAYSPFRGIGRKWKKVGSIRIREFDLKGIDLAVYMRDRRKIKKELEKILERPSKNKKVSCVFPYEVSYIAQMTNDEELMSGVVEKFYGNDVENAFNYGGSELLEKLLKEGASPIIHTRIIHVENYRRKLENLKVLMKYLNKKLKKIKNYPVLVFVGGGANNAGNRFHKFDPEIKAHKVFINTDACHVDLATPENRRTIALLIGKRITKGLGAGGYVDVGEKVMEKDRELIDLAIPEGGYYIVVASLGGGTGGASYKIMELLRKRRKKIIALVNFPLKLEKARIKKAEISYKKIKENADLIIKIDADKILEIVNGIPMQEAFAVIDEIFARTANTIIRNYRKFEKLKGEYTISVADKEKKKELKKNVLAYGEFKPVFDLKTIRGEWMRIGKLRLEK